MDQCQLRSDLARARRVVVKIGSRLLAAAVDRQAEMLAREIGGLHRRGVQVALVTSGAIALGMQEMGWDSRPKQMARLQAAAAIGQCHLMRAYELAFRRYQLHVGQVLLTHDDVADRRRYSNARKTFGELLELGVVPIVNENDTVSIDEIKFGDNDRLAALVAALIAADALIILTDVDGLHTADPAQGGIRIAEVYDIDKEARPYAGGTTSPVGTGGMRSKVDAAAIATEFGVTTVIASGRSEAPVQAILAGEPRGTIFWPTVTPRQARKHWIAHALRPEGVLVVDDGAKRALQKEGRSLLPSGVVRADGRFQEGDPVSILDQSGQEFARGICQFSADEMALVMGRRTVEIAAVLGYSKDEEVVHRDDLALI